MNYLAQIYLSGNVILKLATHTLHYQPKAPEPSGKQYECWRLKVTHCWCQDREG
jgi:hypothetical protein